jgi:hypothetical protein
MYYGYIMEPLCESYTVEFRELWVGEHMKVLRGCQAQRGHRSFHPSPVPHPIGLFSYILCNVLYFFILNKYDTWAGLKPVDSSNPPASSS